MNDLYPDAGLTTSPRKLWYNPKLDPAVAHKMTPKMQEAIDEGTYDDGSEKMSGPLNVPDEWHPANLVSSLCEDGLHRPLLDIDIPFNGITMKIITRALQCLSLSVIVGRSASGNCHAYLSDRAFSWPDYQNVLCDLVDDGWLEGAYVDHSIVRGQTLLRLPGVPKMWSAT